MIFKPLGKSLGKLLGALVVIVAGLFWLIWPSFRSPPAGDFPPPASPREAVQQDLQYLRQIEAYDRSFTAATRAEFARRVAVLEDRGPQLDGAALEMGVAWAVAAADNGHSNARSAMRGRILNALPLRFLWFRDGLYVVKADPSLSELLGARVTGINGHSVEDVSQALRAYVGGRETFAKEHETYPMASPQALHAIGLSESATESTLSLVFPNGGTAERIIKASVQPIVTGADDIRPERDLSPAPWPGETKVWRHVLDGAPLPLYLSHPDTAYWSTRLSNGALYIQLNKMSSEGRIGLPEFLDRTLDDIRVQPPTAVVVDLRYNSGGNYVEAAPFTRELAHALPTDRDIFVLTGPGTFSAAIVAVARFRLFGGSRVHVVGEDVGDRMAYWGEGGVKVLPNSKMRIRYATAMHIHSRKCSLAEIRKCYWLDYFFRVDAAAIDPDIPVRMSFSDYVSGRDPVLETALHSDGPLLPVP